MSQSNAALAYAKTTRQSQEPRDLEYQTFLRVTGRLTALRDHPQPAFTDIAEAVHRNTTLWTIVAADVASDENKLPRPLRGQILSLALYSQKTGREVLRGKAVLDALIEVNMSIIRGLRGTPALSTASKG